MTAIALRVAALFGERDLDRGTKAIAVSRAAPGPAIGAGILSKQHRTAAAGDAVNTQAGQN